MTDSFETNVPSDVSMWTVNPLNTDSQANADLFKDLENLSDLPEITTLEELLAYVQENIIRFDTAPKNYKKDDYKSLLKMINRAMFYIYRRDPEITKILNGVYYIGAATTSTDPAADKTARGYNHVGIYTANQAGVYTNFGVTVTENEANQNITFLVPVFDGTTYGTSYTKVVYALPHMATLQGDRLFDKISFNVSNPVPALLAGQAAWNTDEGTLVVGMNGGDVEQSVGFELYLRIKASVNITNGQLLMQDGTDGNSGVIKAKPAEPGCDPKLIIGIATEDVSINQLGLVTWFGKIRGLNTSAFLPNDELFQSTTTSGALQKTMPAAPNNKSKYAVVINSHATVGTIFVRMQRSQSLNDINNVDTTDSQSGQPLVKQSDGVWKGSYSTTINEIQPAGGTLSVPDATISTKTVEAVNANIGTVVVDTEITAPGYKVESKTDDDFVMANGGTLPISTLKAGIYQLYNPSNNTQIVLEINAAGQVLINGDIIQYGAAYKIDAEEVTTKEQQITLRSDATTGMPIGDLAGFIIKLYDGVNDGMIVIDNTGVLRIGDVGDLQPVLTREESPVGQSPLFFNTTTKRAETLPGTTTKSSLADLDAVMIKDSTDNYKPKWWTFANIKANLKSYFDTLFVRLANVDQTIQGVKTFSSSPIVPHPINDFDAATKEYADSIIVSQDNVEQVRSQATNKVASSKLLDDELTILTNNAESEAIQLVRLVNPNFSFQGFVNTSTATPASVLNNAYISTASGTVLGISGVVKGQVIWANGVGFVAEPVLTILEPQKNKYNPGLAVDNAFYNNSDGALGYNAGWSVTGKIPVNPSTAYSLWKTGSTFGVLHYFDINGAWLGNNTTITTSNITGGYSFTTPANCYFVATWGARSGETYEQWRNLIMLELGAKTTYEAYTLKIKGSLVNSYSKTEVDTAVLNAKNEAIASSNNTSKLYTDTEVNEIKLLLPNNQIVGEGTQSPTVVTIGNGNNLTITAVANDVVFPSEYAYKRRYLATASSGSVYTIWNINYPTTKPSIIAFAYWVKDSDIDAVYTGKGNQQNFWLADTGITQIHMLVFDNVAIKAAVGTTVTGTFDYAGKMSGKWEVTCIDKQNGYSRIAINWYDIIYDPSYIKTNFSLFHIFNGVMPEFNGKTIDFVGFTLVFNEKIVYPSVYPDSAGKLQYPETLLSVNNRVTTLDEKITNIEAAIDDRVDAVEEEVDAFILSQSGSTTVVKSGNALYVRTPFDSTRDLVQSFSAYGESNFFNSNIGYSNVYLIDKTKGNTVADLTTNTLAHLLQAGDDRTPNNYNGTYIGGGHGCSDARLITVNSHGKANVDIGSEWVDDSGRKYYILRIVNSNQLWVISENIGTGDIWQFDSSISGTTLTHSANATNTATMTIAANEMAQLLPAIKNNSKKVYLDGKTEVTTDGVYFCSFCDIVEQYDIVNPASMLLNLIAAVGTAYTDTTLNTALKNGAASVFNQILYRIQSNGALQLVYGWRNYQQINLGYMGFMQAGTPPTTTYPKLKLYMPKILPISDGVKTWDFRNIEAYDVSANQIPGVTNTYWENPLSPPERAVEFLCDSSGNNKVGFAIGYDLTKGIGKVRKDVVSDAWYFFTSRKMYPRGIDNKLNPLLANNWYSCVGYRILFNAENPDMGSASTFYHYELGNEVIVVFDYHTQVSFDNLQLPAKYVGMAVTVVEKSSNITIHTEEVMQNGVTVSVGAGNYGYCVLKLS